MSKEGNVRFTVDMQADKHKELGQLAKKYKITQGEVVEVLLAFVKELPAKQYDPLYGALVAKRNDKVAERRAKRAPLDAFRNMTPEQQLAALSAVGQVNP